MNEHASCLELDRAYEDGKTVGSRSQAGPELCPFSRERLDLRIAWLDGFSDGRWQASRHRTALGVRNAFFGSGIAPGVPFPNRI